MEARGEGKREEGMHKMVLFAPDWVDQPDEGQGDEDTHDENDME